MSPRRAPAQHPELPGYTFEKLLGSGGFSDVYLYQQRLPRRKVAVKVLTKEATEGQPREQFIDEANLMAALSGHSSIVDLYHAGEAADGRPYLVMQYCPLPNLAERIKVRPLGVAETIGIGVRVAAALETAHRAGIVHRDIKPANLLTNEYGRPALTDFGIAGLTSTTLEETAGLSIPWAPPESVEGGVPSGVSGDVYSLGATLYTLLAGRSPFSRPGGPNTRLDLTMRIRRDPVPPIGREDVPVSLQRVLERAMAKDPAQRHPSAVDLGHALQAVEQEMRLPLTDLELPDTSWLGGPDHGDQSGGDGHDRPADQRTVVRQVVEVDPHRRASPSPSSPAPAAHGGAPVEATRVRAATVTPDPGGGPARSAGQYPGSGYPVPGQAGAGVPGNGYVADPGGQPGYGSAQTGPDESTGSRRNVVLTVVVSVAAVAVAAGIVLGAGRLMGDPGDDPGPTAGPTITVPDTVPSPVDLEGERQRNEVTFTWSVPDDVPGDGEVSFTWQRTDPGAPTDVIPADEARAVIEDAPDEVCVSVKIRLENGRTSTDPATACA
ncbi:serine/threonine-protein kinase [Georgenia deserti]|uniref:non-specific serine/threonine protein kinase n=1 Tax=Georgenia deserti TaxID=2093781 RepID=A0ABW4L9Z6_9MICO